MQAFVITSGSGKPGRQVFSHHSPNDNTYSKTCLEQPLSKRPEMGFQDQLSLNAGQKYCRMLQGEHSAILSTCIELPHGFKTFVLSIFEWPLKTGFTALSMSVTIMKGLIIIQVSSEGSDHPAGLTKPLHRIIDILGIKLPSTHFLSLRH